ncbi:hypothetical protein BABINDRAFT_159426 [Babjeviella inositovora NRRL Y-12698]|uniref:Uncharacterized protein n=1 Tax=Babjeviella inositovora NRRL Y-12698 TaxID=984486 RepID=A0A1E3QZA0_9ASCO|nr:uncharacterized protein BABINDRAFT_159426 [Babjeviella inositovora NRRL Y-12698]ODQ82945.1 hypothetical protein BABINDRAFT_159426 [Babjeviella inositovora NRRL Y-12698]
MVMYIGSSINFHGCTLKNYGAVGKKNYVFVQSFLGYAYSCHTKSISHTILRRFAIDQNAVILNHQSSIPCVIRFDKKPESSAQETETCK